MGGWSLPYSTLLSMFGFEGSSVVDKPAFLSGVRVGPVQALVCVALCSGHYYLVVFLI